MRACLFIAVCLTSLSASAGESWSRLEPFTTEAVHKLEPILRRSTDAVVFESTPAREMKQITTLTLVAAAPSTVREIVAKPGAYGSFVRNMTRSDVRSEPDGSLFHTYELSYGVYTVDGRHRYRFPPAGDQTRPAPIEMYDGDAGGKRHYRWEFVPGQAGGTVIVLSGFGPIPRDGLMKRLLDAAPTLEQGLALTAQLTLMLAIKSRAESEAKVALAARPADAGDFAAFAQRGTLVLLRASNGRLMDLSVVAQSAAKPASFLEVLKDTGSWSRFMPTITRSEALTAKGELHRFELDQSLPLLRFSTQYAYRVTASAVQFVGIGGDFHGAQMSWDFAPAGHKTEVVLRSNHAYDRGSMVLRQLYKREPLFEHGLSVALNLLLLDGVLRRAESLASSAR